MTTPAVSELDSLVSQLMNLTRVSREKAEAAIIANRPDLAPKIAITAERDERILEKEEQNAIADRFRSFGFFVRTTSQYRPAKVSAGIPDLWVTHLRLPIAFWWESKRQVGGELSPDQITFRDDCQRCGVGWGTGDRHAAAEYLETLGLVVRVGDQLEPSERLRASR